MDFFAAVKDRHSYRGPFQEKALPDADIRQILQAGLDAPSGLNLQTTSFWVVKNLQLRQEIAALLQIPTNKTVRTVIPLGVPMDSVTAQKKKSYEERVTVVE